MEAVITTRQVASRSASDPVSAARSVELIVCALVLFGLVMAYSASAPYGAREGEIGETFRPFLVHGIKLLLGVSLFFGIQLRIGSR